MESREVEHEVVGDGPPVVLIHSDVADSRLWRAQVEALAPSHRVVTYDRPGFGRTPLAPGPFSQVADLRGLLVAPGLAAWRWSAEMEAADEEETRLFEAGDDEGAAEAQVRIWADGQRRPDEVDPGPREYTREQPEAFNRLLLDFLA